MSTTRWVLIDETDGASCSNGEVVTHALMAYICEAINAKYSPGGEYYAEHGGSVVMRPGSSPSDILPGENVYSLRRDIGAPGASAYHDINGKGVPFARCAVPTCDSVISGPGSVSVDVDHEVGETDGDPGCNQLLDDLKGKAHAKERFDAVEVQTYPYTCKDGTVVMLSNFVLASWENPSGQPPYDYMTCAGRSGAVAPPGPMQTAPGQGGNYQIEGDFATSSEGQVFARANHGLRCVGMPRKEMHWASRSFRRLHGTHPTQLGLTGPEPAGWEHPHALMVLKRAPKPRIPSGRRIPGQCPACGAEPCDSCGAAGGMPCYEFCPDNQPVASERWTSPFGTALGAALGSLAGRAFFENYSSITASFDRLGKNLTQKAFEHPEIVQHLGALTDAIKKAMTPQTASTSKPTYVAACGFATVGPLEPLQPKSDSMCQACATVEKNTPTIVEHAEWCGVGGVAHLFHKIDAASGRAH